MPQDPALLASLDTPAMWSLHDAGDFAGLERAFLEVFAEAADPTTQWALLAHPIMEPATLTIGAELSRPTLVTLFDRLLAPGPSRAERFAMVAHLAAPTASGFVGCFEELPERRATTFEALRERAPTLVEATKAEDPQVRGAAISLIARVPGLAVEHAERLTSAAASEHTTERGAALLALALSGGAMPPLTDETDPVAACAYALAAGAVPEAAQEAFLAGGRSEAELPVALGMLSPDRLAGEPLWQLVEATACRLETYGPWVEELLDVISTETFEEVALSHAFGAFSTLEEPTRRRFARVPPGGPAWSELSPMQRQVLQRAAAIEVDWIFRAPLGFHQPGEVPRIAEATEPPHRPVPVADRSGTSHHWSPLVIWRRTVHADALTAEAAAQALTTNLDPCVVLRVALGRSSRVVLRNQGMDAAAKARDRALIRATLDAIGDPLSLLREAIASDETLAEWDAAAFAEALDHAFGADGWPSLPEERVGRMRRTHEHFY